MPRIPISFARLAAAYPDHAAYPTPALLNSIGGQVRAGLRDNANTCAVRLSSMFNHVGAPIRRLARDIYWQEGAPHVDPATVGHAHPTMIKDLFVIRVGDVKTYLTAKYGAGVQIWDGYHPTTFSVPFSGPTQGIVVFEWRGAPKAFGATGHADLFRLVTTPGSPPVLKPICVGECYWMNGPMYLYLWETAP
jgi:hypothetical protein